MYTHEDVLISLRQIIKVIDFNSKKNHKKIGLTEPQQNLMRAIRDLGKVTLKQLSIYTNVSPATVTIILDRLERNGLVARIRSTEDKRKAHAVLTDKGMKLLDSVPLPLHDSFIHKYNSLDAWEQAQLLSSVQRIASMMNTESIEPAPVLASRCESHMEKRAR
ncbi:MarR family winged helix-turn-helix transcriptional regulator [Photobacterium satsumensis]|uniref:MarR family winged helix-turn-helix transcriptional regulator n=1 Tax=Photobacterium satsumensis TaxID=2910239 RepID=UPI003D10D499